MKIAYIRSLKVFFLTEDKTRPSTVNNCSLLPNLKKQMEDHKTNIIIEKEASHRKGELIKQKMRRNLFTNEKMK